MGVKHISLSWTLPNAVYGVTTFVTPSFLISLTILITTDYLLSGKNGEFLLGTNSLSTKALESEMPVWS